MDCLCCRRSREEQIEIIYSNLEPALVLSTELLIQDADIEEHVTRVIFFREVVILWHINELLHEFVVLRQIIVILYLLHLDDLLAYLVIYFFLVAEQVSDFLFRKG